MPRRRAGSAAGPATSAPAPARGARPRPPPGPAGRAPASPHRPAAPSPPRVGGCGDPRCPPRPAAPGLTLGTSAGEIGNGEETDKRELKKKKTKKKNGPRGGANPRRRRGWAEAPAQRRPPGPAARRVPPRCPGTDPAILRPWPFGGGCGAESSDRVPPTEPGSFLLPALGKVCQNSTQVCMNPSPSYEKNNFTLLFNPQNSPPEA